MKREVVGAGSLQPSPAGIPLPLGRGTYDLALVIDTPRAQVVEYALTCGEVLSRRGQLGETPDQYRTRRLAELNAQQQRDRAAAGAVIGALAPSARVQATQVTPTSTTTVDAQVSGHAVGQSVAANAFPEITQLAPGDVGAARLQTRIPITIGVDTTCTLTTIADDPTVLASYQLTHVRNLDAEAAERRQIANTHAIEVRGALTAQLALDGADPLARQKRLEAEARARAAAEAERLRVRMIEDERRARLQAEEDARRAELRAQADAERARADAERARADAERARIANERARAKAELDAKLELEAHMKLELVAQRESSARYTRTLLVGYLAGECHADAHKRQREREARELKIRLELQAKLELEARLRADRDARDARLRAERDARDARLRAEREARELAEAEQRRIRDEQRRVRDEQRRIEREAREAQRRAQEEARLAIELEEQRRRDALEQHRVEVALAARADLRAYLTSLGARERPPMPALLVEAQGPQPVDGAVWIAGTWRWTGGQWMWVAGGWQDSTRFGASGNAGVAVAAEPALSSETTVVVPASTTVTTSSSSVSLPSGISVNGGISVDVPVIHVRGGSAHKTGSGPVVRDHRH